MPSVKGRSGVKHFIARLPADLENKVLRGAARAGAHVIADDIKENTPSAAVRKGVRIRSKTADDRIKVTIDLKSGWARSVGIWLEYGTSPHFIRVDDSQRAGMSAKRINALAKEGQHSLVIGGHFVGTTVFHPGARAHPTFRPALDNKEGEAVAAAQSYINRRITRAGIVGSDEGDET